ncbi:MAG: hypothetical protein WCJ75_14365 [Desulfomonile sp.]
MLVCDEYVVMPNHVYGILFILDPVGRDPVGRPRHGTTSRGIGIIHSMHGSGNRATHRVAPYEW